MANPLAVCIYVAEVVLWLLMLAAAVHFLHWGAWAWRRRVDVPARLAGVDRPRVTIMLPIRNERHVAERTLRAACALAWPRDRLEVQVLDDSDDDTSALLDRVVAELAAAGAPVAILRRADRRGFKAGNLENGLRAATGEYVCVLDADCVPPADFLERLLGPLVADPALAFVQARWDFENEGDSLLTRVQALLLDGLFLVEQSRVSDAGGRVQWNGTCGVWRRSAVDAAGGFYRPGGGALTEDLDLTLRAGGRGITVPGVAVATELPRHMAAFRTQQKRWVAGAAQAVRARGGASLHLLRHARQPVIVAATLWLPATSLGWVANLPGAFAAWAATLALLHLGLFIYYGAARRRRGRPAIAALAYAPVLVALSVGMSIALTAAYASGLLGRRAEFVRTAKTGGAARGAYTAPVDPLAAVEVAVGAAYVGVAALAFAAGAWLTGAALLVWVASGYLAIGLGSLLDR